MQFMYFVFALSPLIVVLVGILGFKQPAKRVAPSLREPGSALT